MKTQFDTEGEAEKALDVRRTENLGWCPLINEPCKGKNCICYYEGDIHHKEPKQFRQFDPINEYWFVHYPGCTNLLISGVITVES